jgi:D-glycero-D-manno-heptose 1,7-bisphosphate phosphatase
MNKFVILDRDGVINFDSEEYIKSPQEWLPIPGSLEAIALLNQKGYQVVVATNQSGIARKFYDLATLELIHEKMHHAALEKGGTIAGIFFCPHGPDDNCICRKPKPGLLQQIAEFYQISLENVAFVGDSIRDIETAQAAGAKPVLVLTGNGEKTLTKHRAKLQTIDQFANLLSFAQSL